jgi:hypothetical protein
MAWEKTARPHLKNNVKSKERKRKRAAGMARMHEVLSSNPSTTK